MVAISLIFVRPTPGIEPNHPSQIMRTEVIDQHRLLIRDDKGAAIASKSVERLGDQVHFTGRKRSLDLIDLGRDSSDIHPTAISVFALGHLPATPILLQAEIDPYESNRECGWF